MLTAAGQDTLLPKGRLNPEAPDSLCDFVAGGCGRDSPRADKRLDDAEPSTSASQSVADEDAGETARSSAAVSYDTLPSEAPPPEREEPPSLWIRSRALSLLAALAVLYTVYFARAVLVPVAFGVVLSLLLRPIVRWLGRRRVPEVVSAAACLLFLAVVVATGLLRLVEPAQEWVAELPVQLREAELKLRGVLSQMDQINEAKAKFEEIASGDARERPLEVQVQQPRLMSGKLLLSTTSAMLAGVVVVLVLTFFLLTSGDLLISNVLSTLPTFREKRQVVELIQNVQRGVSSYLFTVTVINVALGTAVTLAMWAIGLPNPMLWGVLAAVLNYVPYLGPLACGLVIGLVALLAFDSFAHAALAPLTFFAITTIEGQIITPTFVGRRMSLNPIMVFLFLIFWGWMWGVAGAVLAVPILAITRIACDQFERTQPLGTMLSS